MQWLVVTLIVAPLVLLLALRQLRGKKVIVGNKTEDIEIPHEQGNFITIRALSGLELDDAQEIRSRKVMRSIADMSPEMMQTIRDSRTADESVTREADPTETYDREYVITHAIVGWKGPNYDGVECTTENKRLLDKVTLDYIFKYIVSDNTVPLGNN